MTTIYDWNTIVRTKGSRAAADFILAIRRLKLAGYDVEYELVDSAWFSKAYLLTGSGTIDQINYTRDYILRNC